MPVEPYAAFLNETVTIIAGLSLTLGTKTATVEKRKLPTAEETIDTAKLPLIAVVPADAPAKDVIFDSEHRLREYPIGLAIIIAGTRDTKQDLDTYLQWRRTLQTTFGQEQPWSTVRSYTGHRVVPQVVIDSKALEQELRLPRHDAGGAVGRARQATPERRAGKRHTNEQAATKNTERGELWEAPTLTQFTASPTTSQLILLDRAGFVGVHAEDAQHALPAGGRLQRPLRRGGADRPGQRHRRHEPAREGRLPGCRTSCSSRRRCRLRPGAQHAGHVRHRRQLRQLPGVSRGQERLLVHPLYAELFRLRRQRGRLHQRRCRRRRQQPAPIRRVSHAALPRRRRGLAEETTDASSATTADVTLTADQRALGLHRQRHSVPGGRLRAEHPGLLDDHAGDHLLERQRLGDADLHRQHRRPHRQRHHHVHAAGRLVADQQGRRRHAFPDTAALYYIRINRTTPRA
jgi:hypothetical protein